MEINDITNEMISFIKQVSYLSLQEQAINLHEPLRRLGVAEIESVHLVILIEEFYIIDLVSALNHFELLSMTPMQLIDIIFRLDGDSR